MKSKSNIPWKTPLTDLSQIAELSSPFLMEKNTETGGVTRNQGTFEAIPAKLPRLFAVCLSLASVFIHLNLWQQDDSPSKIQQP